MAKIHNLKELNELGRDLEWSDEIYFTTNHIKCHVRDGFLDIVDHDNNFIFNHLELNNREKNELAKKCYGYKPDKELAPEEFWPWAKYNDFQALERLIRELYRLLDEKDITYEPIENRFEILDL